MYLESASFTAAYLEHNIAVRTELFGGLRATAPAPIVDKIRRLAETVLAPGDFTWALPCSGADAQLKGRSAHERGRGLGR